MFKIVEGEHGDRVLGGLYGDLAHRTRADDIDGFEPKNVLFDHVRIVYSGRELQIEKAFFVDGPFELLNGPRAQQVAWAILSSSWVAVAISSVNSSHRPPVRHFDSVHLSL